jgi:hypothetical protein
LIIVEGKVAALRDHRGTARGRRKPLNDPFWEKLFFMTLVILATAGILGLAGFYLWFVFPVQTIHGLYYLETSDLFIYYGLINLLDVIGINLFARILYFKWVHTTWPLRDGVVMGGYLLVFCWVTDILVYIFIRNTLPTVHDYFLGKNQPEIGIAWIVAFCAAVFAGWLEQRRSQESARRLRNETILYLSGLVVASILLTVIGVGLFDIRP